MPTIASPRGLQDVIANESSICFIDGAQGILSYRGIDIHELADRSTFEETTYLLWHGKLPTAGQLAEFTKQLATARRLPLPVLDFLRTLPKDASPMEVLRTAVSLLSIYDHDAKSTAHEANLRKSFDLTAQVAMLIAIFDRIRKGKAVVDADPELSHAANFLWMLTGQRPSDTATRALDVALILHADHELNASTFAARVIAATLSDMHSAITGAIGALKGPLHGGANEAVMQLLYAVDASGEDPVEHVRAMLDAKQKISGFGHRVYTTEDPRATHLRQMSHDLGQDADPKWYAMSPPDRAVRRREQEAQCQRRFLLRVHLHHAWHRHRPFHAHLRAQPYRGMVRPRPRAARRQPPHSPARRLHRTGVPGAVCAAGAARIRTFRCKFAHPQRATCNLFRSRRQKSVHPQVFHHLPIVIVPMRHGKTL